MARCMVLFNVVASLIVCLVAGNSRYLSDVANKGTSHVVKPHLESCGASLGVCIPGEACPWARLLGRASDDCLALLDHVCCQVARVRMPKDMFAQYSA